MGARNPSARWSSGRAHLFDPVQQRLEPVPVHLTVAIQESQSGAPGNIGAPHPGPDQACIGDKWPSGRSCRSLFQKAHGEGTQLSLHTPDTHTRNTNSPSPPGPAQLHRPTLPLVVS